MSILKVVFIALEVLLLFNLLIFVHELGHFLAARWRGLKIDRFAIWFGKPIWKRKINGVEYALGSIPAGGYVSLPQMATRALALLAPARKGFFMMIEGSLVDHAGHANDLAAVHMEQRP